MSICLSGGVPVMGASLFYRHCHRIATVLKQFLNAYNFVDIKLA